jgi:hypothetical protein
VIRSFSEKKWTVYWEEVQKAADHFGQALKFERKAPANALAGLDLESILNDNYVEDCHGLDRAWAAMGYRTHENTQGTLAATGPPVVTATTPTPPMATTPSTTTTIGDNVSLPTATMTVTTPSVIAPQAPPATTLAPTENQNQENSQVPDQTPAPFESDEQQPNNWQELDNVLEADRYDPQWTLLSLFHRATTI